MLLNECLLHWFVCLNEPLQRCFSQQYWVIVHILEFKQIPYPAVQLVAFMKCRPNAFLTDDVLLCIFEDLLKNLPLQLSIKAILFIWMPGVRQLIDTYLWSFCGKGQGINHQATFSLFLAFFSPYVRLTNIFSNIQISFSLNEGFPNLCK